MFIPQRFLQKGCSVQCALKIAANQKQKALARQNRVKLNDMKTKPVLLNELQAIFNRFIRLRDKDQPCISCGTTKQVINYDAGHYYSRGAYPALRFHPDNVHRQCSKTCNLEKSGNLIEYREGLINRIGIERFERLQTLKKEQLHLSTFEINEMKQAYRLKIRELLK